MEKVRKLHYVWYSFYMYHFKVWYFANLTRNTWIVLKYIDFLWCSNLTSDDCQNFWNHHSFISSNFLCSVLQTTAISEAAIETLNLVVWDHRFELSMCCEIFFFKAKEMHQIVLWIFVSFVFYERIVDEALWRKK